MILITGITGLVGSFIARHFLASGEKVAGLKRTNSDLSLLKDIENNIVWFEGDVLDIHSLDKAIEAAQYVIHAAALVSFAPKDKEKLLKVNVEGTANVVNICLKHQVQKLCFISSVAALGRKVNPESNGKQIITINENAQWEDSPLNSNYAKSKFLGELEVWRGIAEGLNAVIVNPSIILGEADWQKSSTQLFKYVFDEKKFYTGGLINYVDVKDVANIVYQLVHSDITNERFILNAGYVSYKDFFDLVAKAFNKKSPSIKVAGLMLQLGWRLEALRTFFTQKSPLITRETALSASLHLQHQNQKIIGSLHYKFIPLEESVERICKTLTLKS